jgi:GTP pyrophosphokinase
MLTSREGLISTIASYDSTFDKKLVNKAIDYAIKYHGKQLRESGEPYYQHPIEVAQIIADMHLDCESVITAILHDTVEDTELTLKDIEREFSPSIAKLVDGVTKLTKIKFQADNIRQAENFRKLLLAMSDDIRVLLVKLADRLHNMRTIDGIKSSEKRNRIALETNEIYGPLAERIGMQEVKLELQDHSFRILLPDVRESITKRLETINSNGEKLIDDVIHEIKNTLNKPKIKARVFGRQKTPYSVWMKMKYKNVGFDQLSDLIAFRVIVKSQNDCYRALGAIHSAYKAVPETIQDFISTPKNNGYRSIHTVVVGPMQNRIEVQIRTEKMHQIAELGVAAHWRYKQNYQADGKQYGWVRELLSILEQTSDPDEFLQNTKLAMYYDQVFCFTPIGNIIPLPKGATTIDFAFAVGTEIGNHCVGAKVNGIVVPLNTKLYNGDQVEIITSKTQSPSPAWEKIAITGKARAEIKKVLRSQQVSQYISMGQAIVEKALDEYGIKEKNQALTKLMKILDKDSVDKIYLEVGEGTLSREEVLKHFKSDKKSATNLKSTLLFFGFKSDNQDGLSESIPIHGLIPGMSINFAGCCHPLPGDPIIGVVHTGKGITIHTTDCDTISKYEDTPERLMELAWDADTSDIPYITRINIMLSNIHGALSVLTKEIASEEANITNLRVLSRNHDFFEISLDIEVRDTEHLQNIINSLLTKNEIHSVERAKT